MRRSCNLNFICVVAFLVVLVFSSCKKDENNSLVQINGRLTINQINVPIDSVIAVLDTSINFVNGYTERRLLINLFSGNNKLRLIVNNWSFQNPPKNGITTKSFMTCTEDSGCNVCIGVIPNRICDGGIFDWYTLPYGYSSIGTKNGYVDIVSNDTINKTINCLFNSNLLDINSNQDSLLFNGELNNLKYTIRN